MSNYTYYSAYSVRKDLKQYGANALSLFALQLLFDIKDITSIAAEAIVDGPDDGGIDLIHIDREQKLVVVAQTYESEKLSVSSAPLKKAKYLSSGLSLLLKTPIEDVPERLRSSAEQLRDALQNNEIQRFHILYIHNLPGSINVEKELKTVEQTAKALLKSYDVDEIKGLEISAQYLEEKYKSLSLAIQVQDKFNLPIHGGMTMKSGNWKAYVTSVPAYWLYAQFKKYKDTLFSVNVREYLGIRRADKSINSGIQETVKADPEHFWVYNNGITALVHSYKVSADNKILTINGLSIVNGAQTTGAIGNLKSAPNKKAMIQARFIMCSDQKTVVNIKRFNNSQNKIEASDFRSNDPIQERLTREFSALQDIRYAPRRGGVDDIVKRQSNTLNSVLAGQVLSAFHGHPEVAYHQKTKIWEDDGLYAKYFNNETSAKHLFLVYSLFEALKNKKLSLHQKSKNGTLKSSERDQLNFFRTRGSIFLFLAALSDCIETFTDETVPNKFRLEFRHNISFAAAVEKWASLVEVTSNFVEYLREGFSEGAVREKEANVSIKKFTKLIGATQKANKAIYSEFAKSIKLR